MRSFKPTKISTYENVFKIVLTLAFVLLAGYNVYSSTQEEKMPDLIIANIEALASGEVGENYGPADEVKCAGGLHKKICLCKAGYPACTETNCY